MEWLLVAVVVIALVFDFTNGFHDAANAVATSISTRAIPPNVALFGAAVLNVAGALVSTNVAATLAKGIVESSAVTGPVMFGGLVGAITWNLLTWWWALPSSSSHCLVGGVAGAVIATTGSDAVKWDGIIEKVLVPTVIAPVVGFTVGIALMVLLLWAFGRAHPGLISRRFRIAQLISASFMAFSHGSNDAQKTMGVITLALFAGGAIPTADVPLWVKLSSAVVIGLGTYSGGKRIIRTLGMRLVKLTPMHGFAAETSASAVLMATAHFGFPVSTTHVISTSIMGVGATQRLSAVKWGLTRDIFLAWILTLPAAGLIGGLCAIASKLVFGDG
ncbi:MAG: inorganic phosphate transporter [Deltaproteobacteria bacterium]|nr:inorganic phosphate transporter [Deltaproteobacteria bacterium]